MAAGTCNDREYEPSPRRRPPDPVEAAHRLEVSLLLRRYRGDARAIGSDLEAIGKFADWYGLAIVREEADRRIVVLAGTVAQFEHAFSVERGPDTLPGGLAQMPVESITLPGELSGRVEAVLGLDNIPAGR